MKEGPRLCDVLTANLTKLPGQTLTISLSTVGDLNETSIGVIKSTIESTDHSAELISMNSVSRYKGCVHITYQILSSKSGDAQVKFEGSSSDVNSYYDSIESTLYLTLLPCPLGFQLHNNKCECDDILQQRARVSCDIDKQIINTSFEKTLWIGREVIAFFIPSYEYALLSLLQSQCRYPSCQSVQ